MTNWHDCASLSLIIFIVEVLKLTKRNFKQVIEKSVEAIKEGKVIICPTDTVYGLLANAKNKKAVNNIFKIKKRPKNKYFPIFVKNLKTAIKFTKINKYQEKILKKVWPGKITAVLERKRTKIYPVRGQRVWARTQRKQTPLEISKSLTGQTSNGVYGVSRKSIALRIPKYKLINEILAKTDLPLIGTSANTSGEKPSTKIRKVLNQFKKREGLPDLVLDAGNLENSKSSTVIDLRQKKIKIIRQGEIKFDAI